MSTPCPTCDDSFQRFGLHWWHGNGPYPTISDDHRQIFEGLLMGDGSIPSTSGGNNCVFRIPMINRRCLEWVDEELGVLTTGLSLKKTAAQLARDNRQTGFSPNARAENYHDMYTVWSRTHPFFDRLRQKWYASGEKRFPDDLSLTPTLAKRWYASDGYLDLGKWGRPRLEIKARNEIRFTCDDTEQLIEWIGDPPPGFEYKRELDSRARYRELKERAYEEYTTHNAKP